MEELENCSNGLKYADHIYNEARGALSKAEEVMKGYESSASSVARKTKSDAAAEINGRITEWIERTPEAVKARETLRVARDRMDTIERFIRSVEKRMSGAQSAANIHEHIRAGGG